MDRLALVAVLSLAFQSADAQDWPAKPVLSVAVPLSAECEAPYALQWQAKPSGRQMVAFDYADGAPSHVLVVEGVRAGFFRVSGGGLSGIGHPGVVPARYRAAECTWTLRREEWRAALLVNGAVVARLYAPPCGNGVSVSKSLSTPLPRYQPLGELSWSDDFMREERGLGDWAPVKGKWQIAGLEDPRADRRRSANPFSLQATTDDTGVASAEAGYWFWGDRQASVAVKPLDAQAISLDLLVSADGRLALTWTRGVREGKLQWVLAPGGGETVLAERSGGFEPNQWYALRASVSDGFLSGQIDDGEPLAAKCDALGQGAFGLSVRAAPEALAARFDDAELRAAEEVREDFTTPVIGKWTDLQGAWVTDRERHCRRPLRDGESLTAAGGADWTDYRVEADVTWPRGEDAQAGLGVCWDPATRQGYSVRLTAAGTGVAVELVCSDGGGETTLAHLPEVLLPVPLPEASRLFLSRSEGRLTGGLVNGPTLTAVHAGRDRGQCALLANDRRVSFEAVTVSFVREAPPELVVAEQFTQEALMSGWATRAGEWRKAADRHWDYRLPFFGDGTLWWTLPRHAGESRGEALTLTFGKDDFVLRPQPGGDGWSVASFCGKPPERPTAIPAGDVLKLTRSGSVMALSRGAAPLCWRETEPGGAALSLTAAGDAEPDFSGFLVASTDWLDDTFSRAPVNWRVQRGVWDTMQRWTCGPSWSFFGGTHPVSPVIWSKHSFDGDLVLELFAGTQMEQVEGDITPTDLNVTICGDGRDLGSGYSFVYAGMRQKANRLYRRDKLLAETEYKRPSRVSAHTGWFRVRVEKLGRELSLTVNDDLVLRATDDEPLPGGRIAFWSYLASPILARARVAAASHRFAPPVAGERADSAPEPPSAPVGLPLKCDFEDSMGPFRDRNRPEGADLRLDRTQARAGDRCLRVTNLDSGGDFSVWILDSPVVCNELPVLSFDYCVPAEVKVNFYLRLQGRWRELGFTAPMADKADNLGAIAGVVTDGEWHHAEFRFSEARLNASKLSAPLEIEALALTSPAEPYLRSGVLGNPAGCTYYLDNFELRLPAAGDADPNRRGAR